MVAQELSNRCCDQKINTRGKVSQVDFTNGKRTTGPKGGPRVGGVAASTQMVEVFDATRNHTTAVRVSVTRLEGRRAQRPAMARHDYYGPRDLRHSSYRCRNRERYSNNKFESGGPPSPPGAATAKRGAHCMGGWSCPTREGVNGLSFLRFGQGASSLSSSSSEAMMMMMMRH
jgi:hypothetical protein